MFENVVGVLNQIDTAKLNSVLSALAEGVRGQGERIGEATTDANQVLLALNPRSETVRADWRALKGFSDTYSAAAQDILATLERGQHDQRHHHQPRQGARCLAAGHHWALQQRHQPARAEQANLIKAINVLEPTTNLLMKYNPEYTCLLVGAKYAAGPRRLRVPGGNGRSFVLDAAGAALSRRRPVPLPGQPADRRRQGRTRRQAGLRFAARRRQELAGAPPRHQHRLRNRSRLAAQPGYRVPRPTPTSSR